MKKKNPNRRRKAVHIDNPFFAIAALAFGRIISVELPDLPKTKPETIDIPYEEVTEQKQIGQ